MQKENPKYVGRYKDYLSANKVTQEFINKKRHILNEEGNPLFNGYALNAVLEFTKKGNKRFVYRIFTKKGSGEYTQKDHERIREVGKSYRKLPISYIAPPKEPEFSGQIFE